MFRMLQALEREPMNLASQMNKPGMQVSSISVTNLTTDLNRLKKKKKVVIFLYCPCAQQVMKGGSKPWNLTQVIHSCCCFLGETSNSV